MTIESRRSKRKIASQSTQLISAKKLRSNIQRRRRSVFSPIVLDHSVGGANARVDCSKPDPVSISVNSACDEVSCNTTRDSVAGARSGEDVFRRVTRSYARKKEIERAKLMNGGQGEVSESSCVESCSIAEVESKLKSKSDGVNRGCGFVKDGVVARQEEAEVSGVKVAPNSASTIEQSNAKRSEASDSALACSENLWDDDDLSSAFTELQSQVLVDDFDINFSSDTSLWTDDSGSQFTQPTPGVSVPSPCATLFKQYSEQFTRLSSQSFDRLQVTVADEFADEFMYWRFEDEEDEQSYQRLRGRERKRSLKMDDYVAVYASTTEYGIMIHEQRLLMVNWIVETSETKDLHNETTFLAIRLLDRFLSKGFFENRKSLEIAGIACLTLATRIEEKQPYNCVLQKLFHVKENVYGRTEVVAMEWLIQEELKYQCCSPTAYNFLWSDIRMEWRIGMRPKFYLKAAAADEAMEDLANHLAELTMFDHRHLQFWPSTVAAGIVMLVSLAAKQDESCVRVMEAHVRTNIDDLPECIRSMEWLVKYAS